MARRAHVVRNGGMIFGIDSESKEILQSMKNGQPYFVDIKQDRSGPFHKKAFAFVNLAFHYWEPVNFLHQVEIATTDRLCAFLQRSGLTDEAVATIKQNFYDEINQSREGLDLTKDIESFREWITIQSGFYKTTIGPAGPRKEAISWAYSNLGQEKFERLFVAIRETCWNLILKQKFKDIEEAEKIAEQMMSFD